MDPGERVTVRRKVVVAERAPSETVSVTVAMPVRPAAGVAVTVRLAPLPPRTSPLVASRVVSDEAAVTVRAPGAVWVSPTWKGTGPVELPAVMLRSPMALTMGGVARRWGWGGGADDDGGGGGGAVGVLGADLDDVAADGDVPEGGVGGRLTGPTTPPSRLTRYVPSWPGAGSRAPPRWCPWPWQ